MVTSFIVENIAVLALALLAAVVVMLVVIVVVLTRRNHSHHVRVGVDLTAPLAEIERALSHHTDVSAVVQMVRQIDELDEDAMELLKSYPENVRAAAWLHRINCLGADLQAAQQKLSDSHQGKGSYSSVMLTTTSLDAHRKRNQELVDEISNKLNSAIETSHQMASN